MDKTISYRDGGVVEVSIHAKEANVTRTGFAGDGFYIAIYPNAEAAISEATVFLPESKLNDLVTQLMRLQMQRRSIEREMETTKDKLAADLRREQEAERPDDPDEAGDQSLEDWRDMQRMVMGTNDRRED